MSIDIGVLGPLRITVDGTVVEAPAQVAPLLVALAVPAEPIRKLDLAREVLYLSPGSIDSRLSRLHRLLGLETPLHRVPVARSGRVQLDRGAVDVDADRFRALVAEAESLIEAGHDDDALQVLLRADDLWRTGPSAWEALGDADARTPFGQARDGLTERRRHVRELAGRLGLERPGGVPPNRLFHWTREGDAPPSVWHARIVSELDTCGVAAARASLAEWAAENAEGTERARQWAALLVAHGTPREGAALTAPHVADPRRDSPAPVGREDEYAELWRYAEGVAKGRGGLHLLAGGAGSGKTHLLAHLQRHARVDLALCAVHVDVEEETGLYRVLRRALTPLWQVLLRRADPPDEVVDRAGEIAAVVGGPTLDEPKGVEGREPVSPVQHAAGLAGAVLRAIDQPVLLVLDNIHRATPELLEVMTRLSRDSLGLVGVVASLRPEGCFAAALTDAPALTVLEPFDIPTAGRFLSSIRGRQMEEREVERLYRRAGGVPLALLNVSDEERLEPNGPCTPSVMTTLGRWLESRPPAARRALGIAAVLAEGTRFDLALVEQILAGEPEAIDALSTELDVGIEVHRVGDQVAFTHRAWQEAAYATVEPRRRRVLHQRVLGHLERQLVQASDPTAIATCASAIAHHASRADFGGLATTIGLGALVRAADTLAPFETATAISLYGRALQIARPDEQLAILLRQGRTRRLAAEWDAAEVDLLTAADLALALGDVVAEAEAALLMAHMTWDPVRWGGTLADRLASVLTRLPPDEVTVRARVQACLAGGTYQDGVTGADPDSAAFARCAAGVVDQLDAGDAAEVLMWARKGLLDIEPPELTLGLATRMRQLSRGSSYLTGNAILASIVDRIRLADHERARRDTCAYRALATATGSPVQRYIAAILDALWSLYDGRFDDAEEAIGAAQRFGREFGGTTARQVVAGQRVLLARERGDLASAPEFVAHLDEHRPADGGIPVWSLAVGWLHADCGLVAPAGDRLRRIAACTDDFRALPRGPHRIVALGFAAETIFRLEQAGSTTPCDRRTARRVSVLLRAHTDRQVLLGWPVAHLGPTLRYAGLGAVAGGDVAGGLRDLHAALRGSTSAPHRARILIDIASVLERVRPAAARRALDQGQRLAEEIGMLALARA
jgi:AAA ATPase domain